MKYIATSDFSQGSNNPLNLADGSRSVKIGTIVDIGGDLPIEKLPKNEYLRYSNFFPRLVPLDSDKGKEVLAEVKITQARAKRSIPKPKTDWARASVWVGIAGLVIAVVIYLFR